MRGIARLLTVTHSLSRRAGGLYFSVRRLAQSAAERGVPVDVLGLRDPDTERDLPLWQPLHAVAFDCVGPPALGYAPALHRELSHLVGPGCVLHLHGLWKLASQACLRVSEQTGVPRVISPRGMLDTWALQQSSGRKRLAGLFYENANLRGAHCLHALNPAELRQIRDFGLRRPVAVVPNGVDIPELRDRAPPRPGPAEGKRVILFLSRVHPKKGLLPLVDAWSRCAKRFPEWLLAIAGPDDGGHAAEVDARIRSAGVEEQTALVGPQYGEQKAAWLHCAELFVLPSLSEGFPMAVLEAMAYQLPVLMTPQCNFPEAAQCGAALNVAPEAGVLAEALQNLLAMSDGERAELGKRGKTLVQHSYSWDRIAETMIEVYEWLLGGDRPDCVER